MTVRASSVRIWATDGTDWVGSGVLVADGLIATPSHVVSAACGQAPTEDAVLQVDFYGLSGSARLEAVCVSRLSTGAKPNGLAVLRIEHWPSDARPALPALTRSHVELAEVTADVQIFGLANGFESGLELRGQLRAPDGPYGLAYVKDEARVTITKGFSGGGIWSLDGQHLHGIVNEFDESRRFVKFLNTVQLSRALRPHAADNETEALFRWFRQHGILALLNDLEELESDGLDDDECKAVKACLGMIANALSGLHEVAEWNEPIHKDIERLRDVYETWNEWPRGAEGERQRAKTLAVLRDERHSINGKLRLSESFMKGDDVQTVMRQVAEALHGVSELYPHRFGRIAAAVGRIEIGRQADAG